MGAKGYILLVDDEPHIADVVEYKLQEHGFHVQTARDGLQGREMFRQRQPDLVILDLNLPGIGGLDLFREMKSRAPGLPVIMLTCRGDEADRVLGLEMGADDYVTKPFSPRELVARVKTVLRRTDPHRPAAEPAHVKLGPLLLDTAAHAVHYFGRMLTLTRQEYGLLHALITHPARVFERDELVRIIYHDAHPVTDRSIDACIKRIRKKMAEIHPGTQPIRTVYGMGYKIHESLSALDGEADL
jgi:DNA-binding response OmpR family regulator